MRSSQTVFSMDIGGTRTKNGLVDLKTGRIIAQIVHPTCTDHLAGFIRTASDAFSELCLHAKLEREEVLGGGVGIPGYVDGDTISMVWKSLAFMEGSGFGRKLEQGLGIPLRLDNDARIVALGEAHFGGHLPPVNGKKNTNRLLSLSLGTGLGIALVVNGKLQENSSLTHLAGHFPVRPGGERCFCGFSGCFETLVSADAILQHHNAIKPSLSQTTEEELLSVAEIFMKAEKGVPNASQAVRAWCEDLLLGINAFIHIYAPDVIVLGGGIASSLAPWLPFLRAGIFARPYAAYQCHLTLSALKESAGLLGGASLWVEDEN